MESIDGNQELSELLKEKEKLVKKLLEKRVSDVLFLLGDDQTLW